jgi:2-polyprenyl-3-methyl-5-hydroxy-6-metoxy-1,4-benzoquinol methylase
MATMLATGSVWAARGEAVSEPPQQDLYPDQAREEVRPFVPAHATSALDVGCARGGFGVTLRGLLGAEARIVGVEAVPSQAAMARVDHGFDEVIDGYFPDALTDRTERFDVVCFNDVLEHVIDPWALLRETRGWLTPGGTIVAAIPSIQFAPVVLELVRGRWDYRDAGTLDRTHLRFFTRATMIEMFEQTGYVVRRCEGVNDFKDEWLDDHRWMRRLLKRAVVPLLKDARYMHFVVEATESPS